MSSHIFHTIKSLEESGLRPFKEEQWTSMIQPSGQGRESGYSAEIRTLASYVRDMDGCERRSTYITSIR